MTATEKPQKRTGRPPKAATERKRNIQTVRLRDALKDRLAISADKYQRSISEEIEARVERSYRIEDEFGYGDRLMLIRLIGSSLRMAEIMTGEEGYNTKYTNKAALQGAKAAIMTTLDRFIEGMPSDDADSASPAAVSPDPIVIGNTAATLHWLIHMAAQPGGLANNSQIPGLDEAVRAGIAHLVVPAREGKLKGIRAPKGEGGKGDDE